MTRRSTPVIHKRSDPVSYAFEDLTTHELEGLILGIWDMYFMYPPVAPEMPFIKRALLELRERRLAASAA